MNMWGLLMIILAVLSAAGILYLASRIGRFWIIKRIAKEKRNILYNKYNIINRCVCTEMCWGMLDFGGMN